MSMIEIKKIGITKLDTDAIVNAANEGLWEGSGIKLKEHRLFASKEEAEASIPKAKPKYRSPYE